MRILTSYSVRLAAVPVRLQDTLDRYRAAVDFFIRVMEAEWTRFAECNGNLDAVRLAERLCISTKTHPDIRYDFSAEFYKFPSYMRRAAIAEAYGLVSSYRSNLAAWRAAPSASRGRRPGMPEAGFVCPAMYRDNSFVRTGTYTARIKVWVRNTWDWIDVALRKTDVDYILRHCASRRECVPTLRRRGKVWSLDFSFEEDVVLPEKKNIDNTRILSVDLGVNSACVCSAMNPDGTVTGRRFLRLPGENDRLERCLGRMRGAQQRGARRMPRLWAAARGTADDIAVKTAAFIIETAVLYNVDVIVLEALDTGGRKRGSKRQRLTLWKARYVQAMVGQKAHRLGMRVSRVCVRNTSRLAFDGSGAVRRGRESERTGGSWSVCEFTNGKVYNCDLNASYNIGARYYIREILREKSERTRSVLEAKVPAVSKRSTCTLSDLKDLRAALAA